ncbi:uncharacterized protein LOC127246901 [Andrographis paniculata]|uniref:uncharacterized protein LOC127246901 n=1 Tax=Andrographis paniculata TaxID=175694 RepID=UPI0021E89F98|nr:uncharacterized protein LOC127246901 [Andrographis paniculata]XP_051124493.1 uncharacterized protein LOC127246901 [Andrographis paniculata]
MEIFEKKRVQFLLFIAAVVALSITAEKCRLMVGEEAASKSGQFTILNCFDGNTGTLACVVKEGVKLYFYNIRAMHMESRRNQAIEAALADAVAQGLPAKEAAKVAQKEGAKAAKLAKQEAKRIIGPIVSSGWDFFEALYFGGTLTEGFLRGTGTLFGTYTIGVIGEQRFGRFGYLVGSHLGSWVGGRIGLMVYDVVNGVEYLLQFVQSPETELSEDSSSGEVSDRNEVGSSEAAGDSFVEEQVPEDFYSQESSSMSDESNSYPTPPEEIFDAHDEF